MHQTSLFEPGQKPEPEPADADAGATDQPDGIAGAIAAPAEASVTIDAEPSQPHSGDGGPPDPPGDGDSDDEEPPEGTVSLLEATRTRYLNYALSVITARALPDVRDGLKPVQRRILYAMHSELRLLPTARFRKSAAVVGAVMARFHPHGDQSIYDAMVRLAQPFSLRQPLVEGHGNFGSLDGDPPAAMRYTEARLRPLAVELAREIAQDTVAWQPNYDGTTEEPVVLPARFPNLLCAGVTGIAVGMATSIPPHNLREVCRAAAALIDDPALDTRGLMAHVEGPDFPIGGEVLNSRDELLTIYETGRGSIRLRGTYEVEKLGRKRQIVVDSVPYGVNKAQLVEQVGALIAEHKVPQLLDVRDESTDDVRIVLELKRGASDVVAMAYLYKHTTLRTTVPVNMTLLVPTDNPGVGAPAQLGLREVLRHFLDFRKEVVERRFRYELRKLEERIHILRGFVIVFDALDEVIALIRASENKKDAAERLMARFPLDAVQTEAILELKLYRLAKLQIEMVREELERLEAEAARIRAILASEAALWNVVREELVEVAAEHGDDRRTRLGAARAFDFDANNYIVRSNTWVIVTRGGWIKRQKGFSDLSTIRVRDNDSIGWVFRCSTRSTLAFFTDSGRAYVLVVDDVPQTSGYGEPVQARFNFDDGEQVVGVVSMDERNLPEYGIPLDEGQPALPIGDPDEEDTLRGDTPSSGPLAVAITRSGKGLLFPLTNHTEASTKSGRKFASLDGSFPGGDGVVGVVPLTEPGSKVCLASKQGRAIVFEAESLKLLGGTGRGVNAIRLGEGDHVLDFVLSAKPHVGLVLETNRGSEKRVTERRFAAVTRGGKGHLMIKRGHLVAVPRDPEVADPLQGGEDEAEVNDEDLDAIAEHVEQAGGSDGQ